MRAMVPERLDAYMAGTNTKASHTADRCVILNNSTFYFDLEHSHIIFLGWVELLKYSL
jgi:hypothetical protein